MRNQIGVQQEYVKEARENLAIARVRAKMGFCGNEEVMRWASQLSISEQKLLEMTADYKNVKVAISKFLNEKQNANFELKRPATTDGLFILTPFIMQETSKNCNFPMFSKIILFS